MADSRNEEEEHDVLNVNAGHSCVNHDEMVALNQQSMELQCFPPIQLHTVRRIIS